MKSRMSPWIILESTSDTPYNSIHILSYLE
uniref:Uncharacterized protein n=1 Tax=Physcomitrium patens TaxID=3218 RepID=A0A2K1L042_PHYPA|nr:hypothetical protein PHYPA_002171 [Physcomitrium patens]